MPEFSDRGRDASENTPLHEVQGPERESPVKKLIDGALGKLSDSLREGKSENLQNVLRVMGRFHRYSFTNALLIAMNRPDATHVLGFQSWKEVGRHVRKGEKGIPIIAPITGRSKDEEEELPPEESPAAPHRTVRRFRAVYVFDISQTEGEPLPTIASHEGDPGEHLERLREAISGLGIQLAYVDLAPGHAGRSLGRKIEVANGLPPAEEFATLVHELAHELLHQKEGEVRPPKSVRETEAEAVAFAVSTGVGLESTGAASDYIQLYRGDPEVLAQSLGRIREAAATILDHLLAPPGKARLETQPGGEG